MTARRTGALLAAALAIAAGAVLAFDRWVAATVLPPLTPPTSAVVVDRTGALLSAYTVANGPAEAVLRLVGPGLAGQRPASVGRRRRDEAHARFNSGTAVIRGS